MYIPYNEFENCSEIKNKKHLEAVENYSIHGGPVSESLPWSQIFQRVKWWNRSYKRRRRNHRRCWLQPTLENNVIRYLVAGSDRVAYMASQEDFQYSYQISRWGNAHWHKLKIVITYAIWLQSKVIKDIPLSYQVSTDHGNRKKADHSTVTSAMWKKSAFCRRAEWGEVRTRRVQQ